MICKYYRNMWIQCDFSLFFCKCKNSAVISLCDVNFYTALFFKTALHTGRVMRSFCYLKAVGNRNADPIARSPFDDGNAKFLIVLLTLRSVRM